MFLTQIANGKLRDVALCQECAKKEGIFDPQQLSIAGQFFPKELSPDTWSGSSYTEHSITVLFNGKEATLKMRGYNEKTIVDYVDEDGNTYNFVLTLSATGNTFTYEKKLMQSAGGGKNLEFPSNNIISGLTCADGSTLNLHKLGNSIYVYGEMKIDVGGKTMPSFDDYGTPCTSVTGNVITFIRPYLSDNYEITATIDQASMTFTYTYKKL